MKNNIFDEIKEKELQKNDFLLGVTSKSQNSILTNTNSDIPISKTEIVKTTFTQSNLDIMDKKTVKPQFQKNTIGKANGRRGHGRGCV